MSGSKKSLALRRGLDEDFIVADQCDDFPLEVEGVLAEHLLIRQLIKQGYLITDVVHEILC